MKSQAHFSLLRFRGESSQAATILAKHGFMEVYNLEVASMDGKMQDFLWLKRKMI